MPERALTGPRRLTLEVPAYQGDYSTGLFPPSNGWSNGGLSNALMFESALDLSGYQLDKLTFYTQAGELQDPGRYIYDIALTDPVTYPTVDVEVLDIVSQERLSLTAIDAQLLAGNVPGMLGTTEDFTQIIFGNYRVMVVSNTSANAEILMPVTGGTFGSGEPTAASRLWCYRIVRINGTKAPTDIFRIPASRFVLQGIAAGEEELPYMMRLKRSFELSTQG
jgi:hypothetical protein